MAEPNELASTNFKQMFKRFDITDEDFTVVPHTFDIEAFEKGDVDAMTVFLTNEVFQLNQKRIPFNILDPSSYGVPFYDGNLFTSDSYARSHPETVAAFLTASNRGWKYALEHSEEIIDLIKGDTTLKISVVNTCSSRPGRYDVLFSPKLIHWDRSIRNIFAKSRRCSSRPALWMRSSSRSRSSSERHPNGRSTLHPRSTPS
ncbi:ABC transporter substrate-binding protein [Candidatus Reidiella endopervernicosa]|uniref:Thiamine pyrimidine synthase n=1 Tax=Candidatus Reidiella endopervernicosa TaxID=2738883 RepID=A0A6N0HYB4_9GAMM|nr:ABC transporter substrate-binding protein [Candidatus Reidiella endopervernicosa]